MYRFVIEHPRWISPERLATLDVRAGADKGRIYRIYPEGKPLRKTPRLDTMTTTELVSALDTPNGPTRDNVQRLLVHRADRTAIPFLKALARSSSRPECRMQALCTLDGLGGLDGSLLRTALSDAHPGVRAQAVRLSEPWLGDDVELGKSILSLVDDPAITVRYQLALSLGAWDAPETGRALGRLAVIDPSDQWIRAAVLSSSTRHAAEVLDVVIASSGARGPDTELIEPLIATLVASRNPEEIGRALKTIERAGRGQNALETASWRFGATASLLESASDASLLETPAVREMIASARRVAIDSTIPATRRVPTLRLIGRVPAEVPADLEILAARLAPEEPIELQVSGIEALARMNDARADDVILAHWPQLGPTLRDRALDALMGRTRSKERLMTALENAKISPAEIDATNRQQLLSADTEALRKRAARVFASQKIGPRQAIVDAFASSKNRAGDAVQGRRVFTRVCAACHKLGGEGHEVGPDLAALTDHSPDALITAIFDPNREVDARYATYSAALKDGRVVTGLIAGETASSVNLKRQEGRVDAVLRSDLEELVTTGRSLMPEGLENDLKPGELSDLLAFLSSTAARPKELAGNRPVTVRPGRGGVLRLDASAAEIYGPNLTYETALGNIGYWHSPDDYAAWSFQVTNAGTYTLSMDWACADESAGNSFTVKLGQSTIRSTVDGTGAGTWANYRSIFLGRSHTTRRHSPS